MIIKKVTRVEESRKMDNVRLCDGEYYHWVRASITIWYFLGIPFRKDIVYGVVPDEEMRSLILS